MTIEADTVVTVNAGSSSIKVVVFAKDQSSAKVSHNMSILLSGIGQPISMLQMVQADVPTQTEELHSSDHVAGARIIIERLKDVILMDKILAVGHRLVHGGTQYTNPMPVERISEADWQLLTR